MHPHGRLDRLEILTADTHSRDVLDAAAAEIFGLFAEREKEFAFNPSIIVDYPDMSRGPCSPFLVDPVGTIEARIAAAGAAGDPVARVVVLTTFGDIVGAPLEAASYRPVRIDMPAGPDHTFAFTRDLPGAPAQGRTLYLEAVDEQDEKIRPTFALRLRNEAGRLCAGACGAVHERAGRRHAYLATLTVAAGLPPGTGTALARAMLDHLRAQGVVSVNLGTQTAGRFYEKLGFRVDLRLIEALRTRRTPSGEPISHDLAMLSIELE